MRCGSSWMQPSETRAWSRWEPVAGRGNETWGVGAYLCKSSADSMASASALQSKLLLLVETDFLFVRPLQGIPAAEWMAPIGFHYLNMNPASVPVCAPVCGGC